MRRRGRKKAFSKERIIMAASSVVVLGALTATGLWLRDGSTARDEGYIVDLSAIEQEQAAGEAGEQSLQIAENVTDGVVPDSDLDYDPYFQETNSGKVENPDLSGSESMSDGTLTARMGTGEKTDGKTSDGAAPDGTSSGGASSGGNASDGTARGSAAAGSTDDDADTQEDGSESGADAPAISTAMQPALSFTDEDSLVWPVVGNILINYSMDKTVYFPTLDQYKYNPAIVIAANEGDMITAAAAGKVTSVFEDPRIGSAVTMELGGGYEVTYGQLTNILVSEGSYVSMGDMIAQVAAPTRYYSVEGTNVYFELTRDGEPVNPLTKLP